MKKLLVGSLFAISAVGFADIASIEDVQSMVLRSDGNYDVLCKNGTREIASPGQISKGNVCNARRPQPNENVEAIFSRGNGSFYVLCRSGGWEISDMARINRGEVCDGIPADRFICSTTTPSTLQFQISGSVTDRVQCFYRGPQNGPFLQAASYDVRTKRWSCADWQRGNPQYDIDIVVNGAVFKTNESEALSKPCSR